MDNDWEYGEYFSTFLSMGMIVIGVICFFCYHIMKYIWQTSTTPVCNDDYYYEGPLGLDCWSEQYPLSLGCRQSPINIDTDSVIELTANNPLICINFAEKPLKLELHNEGHTAWILGRWCFGKSPQISGGPLKSKYMFHCLAFRWGPGSEHSINYGRYDMEVQLLFLKQNVSNLLEASICNQNDCMAVVSYCYNITEEPNPFLEHVCRGLPNIISAQSASEIDPKPLCWIAPTFDSNYFCYKGSLTFPPCAEVATWILQPEPLGISRDQFRKFKRLKNNIGNTIIMNTRPIQNLNQREIRFYKKARPKLEDNEI